jgi:spermidine synthase
MTDNSSADQSTLPVYSSRSLWLVGLCFVLSGATGLIYEVLWARMLGLVFGATTLAVSTVLAAFMGGLALGSALAGRMAARLRRPLRSYALIEISIAVYALLVPLLFRLTDSGYALIWQQLHPGFYAFSLWRFVLSCATLLVPTTLMGATLPVLSAALLRAPTFKSTSITRLYTCNLAGAIFGTVAAGFFLLPALGLRKTIYIAAAINIVIGVFAIIIDCLAPAQVDQLGSVKEQAGGDVRTQRLEPTANGVVQISNPESEGTKFWLCCAFVSGFVTISTQVAWTRVLTMIIGSSTYAFSVVVALFLVGLSAGAYTIGRKERWDGLRPAVFRIELFTAFSLWLSIPILNKMPGLLVSAGLKLNVGTWGGLLSLQIFSAALLILLPAFLMGMVMPLVLVWAVKARSDFSVRLVGRSYAVNTIGAIAGAFCAGFILVPKAGTRITVLFAAALCLIVAGLAFPALTMIKDRDLGRAFGAGGTVALVIILFLFAPALNLDDLSIGAYDSLVRVLARARGDIEEKETAKNGDQTHQLLLYKEGPTSTVSVRKDWGVISLAINGRTNASDSEGDMPTQVMLAQLPVLLAPRLNNGLIVGFATGVSAGAILQSPIESVTGVELEPTTIDASRLFEHVNGHPLNDPRFHLVIDDARTHLRVNPARYDIIMSEPSHPWVPGVANLFTEEFFTLGRERLNDDGVFVQWLQVYQLSTESLRSVLGTFQKVFPHVMIFRVGGTTKGKDLILAGSRTPLTLNHLAERLRDVRISAELSRVGLKSEADVRAWYVCDETRLGPAVAGAVINTDDNMHVETTAPREAFLPLMQTNAAWIEALARTRWETPDPRP